ncbi:MAG: hypothetical protein NTX22_18425 [Ignavibacteriales bacterium]|nr:hypothetical protein [Ignavibacteriales bacterium]
MRSSITLKMCFVFICAGIILPQSTDSISVNLKNSSKLSLEYNIRNPKNYLADNEKMNGVIQINFANTLLQNGSSELATINFNANADEDKKEDKSFFKNDFFYFLGTAVVAATVYLLWPEKEIAPKTSMTFGKPLPPR